jgi:hypothetical protein
MITLTNGTQAGRWEQLNNSQTKHISVNTRGDMTEQELPCVVRKQKVAGGEMESVNLVDSTRFGRTTEGAPVEVLI